MQLTNKTAGSGSCLPLRAKAEVPYPRLRVTYLWNLLKFIIILISALSMNTTAMANEPNPKITLSKKNSTLQEVFKEIHKQTNYSFVYNNEMLREAKRISISVKDASLETVLSLCFKDQPVTYSIIDKIVVVKEKKDIITNGVSDTSRNNIASSLVNVQGMVLDEQSNPIEKATIAQRNSRNATATDKDGKFLLSGIPVNTTLLVTCVGYEPMMVVARKNQPLNIQLRISVNKLDESIVVAYNTTTQRANTGAVTVVKGEEIQNLPSRSFDKSLQGLVPGLVVTSGSGQPGAAPSNFLIRGIATGGEPLFGETYRNPLIIIDGVPVTQDPTTSDIIMGMGYPSATNPMAQINPSDIESISVLKDAAAASLYGSKASNGVILVTTKRGKQGKTIFSFRHQTDIASRLEGKVKVLDQAQYLELVKESYRNTIPGATDDSIMTDLYKKFPYIVKTPGDTSFYPQADWAGALYNNHALTNTTELSISGGNSKINYYLNLELSNQNGVVKKTDYNRKSLRFNIDNRVASWLKLSLNTMFSYNVQNYNLQNGAESYISPLLPIRDLNNKYIYDFSWGYTTSGAIYSPNPVAAADLNIFRNTSYRGLGSLTATLTPFKFLTLSSRVGFDYMQNEGKQKLHPFFRFEDKLNTGRIIDDNVRNASVISTNSILFSKDIFRGHNLQLMAVQEAQIRTNRFLNVRLVGIGSNPDQEEIIQGKGGNIDAAGRRSKQTLLSYLGSLNYGIQNKYFISGSIRADGSSQFGKNSRFGTFWSVGGGWITSEEKWFKEVFSFVNLLKFRGSYGSAGNSAAIADAFRFDPLSMITYMNGTAVYPSTGNTVPGNPSIEWESTKTWNAGIELRLFGDRASITGDMYVRKTKNLIAYNIPIPTASGYAMYPDNIGDIKNKGIEVSVRIVAIKERDFSWTISGNWSRNTNRLTKSFFPKLTPIGSEYLVNEVGQEYNSFYMPIWAGVNSSNGRPTWLDSSGKATEDYRVAKKEIVGKSQPDGSGSIMNSFRYKGLDFSFSLYFQYGSKVYYSAGSSLINDGLYPFMNQVAGAYNRWTVPGQQNALNPRRLLDGAQLQPFYQPDEGASRASTRYLYDGDFIRLSNLVVGYNFPERLTRKLHLSMLRVYLQGNNLATWTRYSGSDPENINAFGTAAFLYPMARNYSFGIQVNF